MAPANDAAQRERRTQAHALLLAWYAREGRATLPWRHTRDPYAVLVSEMMLQQTQVERALPKYQAFLARFPTLAVLAAAPTGEVIKEWAGLGYNMRAVRLREIAQQAMANGGALPNTLEGLLALKGIGRYTAGAVACFGLGLPVATVDTNIRRVLWRVFRGIEPTTWPTGEGAARALLALAEWALPDAPPTADAATSRGASGAERADQGQARAAGGDGVEDGVMGQGGANGRDLRAARVYDWQQALMDLGAMVCQSRRPYCERCPLTQVCAAYAETAQVTLFPSGEALARLRGERAEAARTGWSAPDAAGARRVAERRAGYTTGEANADVSGGASLGDDGWASQRATSPGKSTRGATKARGAQPFTNTTRYFRGRIVDILRSLPASASLTLAELGPQVKPDYTHTDAAWLRGLVDGLARDGLAHITAGEQGSVEARVALP